MNTITQSEYKSASGHLVTLYKGPNGKVTVVDGDITVYDNRDEMHGASSLEAALSFIK